MTNHPNMLTTDFAGESATPSQCPRLARANTIGCALDDSGDFDARSWSKGSAVRVYVKTSAGKDCGYLAINADLSIDRSGLTKQAGTIAGIASAAVAS